MITEKELCLQAVAVAEEAIAASKKANDVAQQSTETAKKFIAESTKWRRRFFILLGFSLPLTIHLFMRNWQG